MEAAGQRPAFPTQHAALLAFVREQGKVRNGEVAKAFGVTPSSASGMLQRAMREGFLVGEPAGGGRVAYSLNLPGKAAVGRVVELDAEF